MVFNNRLKRNVTLQYGNEIDEYDLSESPVYVAVPDGDRRVIGSLRVLPTTDQTMLKNSFRVMFQGDVDIECATAWECTRFCVHPSENKHVTAKSIALELLLGLCDLALASGMDTIIGVCVAAMERVYQRLGWSPIPLQKPYPEVGFINCGIWEVSPKVSNILENNLKKIDGTTSGFTFPNSRKHKGFKKSHKCIIIKK